MEAKLANVFIKPDPADKSLHRDQIRAVNVMRGQAKCDHIDAVGALAGRFTKIGHADMIEPALEYVANAAPAITHVSEITLRNLLEDTHYRSTFEITTKGAEYLEARKVWESACFHKLYDGVVPFERPKYGVLNILSTPAGVTAAVSYGQCYIEYQPHVRKRITLAAGDTSSARIIGVLDYPAHIMQSFTDDELLGIVDILKGDTHSINPQDIYREIQIHGEVDIARDVAAVHAPRSIEQTAVEFGKKFNIRVVLF